MFCHAKHVERTTSRAIRKQRPGRTLMCDMTTRVAKQHWTKDIPAFRRIRLDQQTPSSSAQAKALHFQKPLEPASELICGGRERLSKRGSVAARVVRPRRPPVSPSAKQNQHRREHHRTSSHRSQSGGALIWQLRLKTTRGRQPLLFANTASTCPGPHEHSS